MVVAVVVSATAYAATARSHRIEKEVAVFIAAPSPVEMEIAAVVVAVAYEAVSTTGAAVSCTGIYYRSAGIEFRL